MFIVAHVNNYDFSWFFIEKSINSHFIELKKNSLLSNKQFCSNIYQGILLTIQTFTLDRMTPAKIPEGFNSKRINSKQNNV